jgi:transcriptional regulator with XRE-family HTH domain
MVAYHNIFVNLILYFFMEDIINKSIFAKNLIAIRKAKGLSQRDLAKLSNISNRVIAYYETKSSIPSYEILVKIAKALNTSICSLIDPEYSDKNILGLNTRTIKKIKLLDQLSPENQRKVTDYIKALLAQERLNKEAVKK